MEAALELAKVTSKGQITIPKAIRDRLGLRSGDKVLFAENPDGSVTMRNATVTAMRDLQDAFEGAAEEAGLEDDGDLVEMIREVRAEKRGRR